jgi:hypothetical protein
MNKNFVPTPQDEEGRLESAITKTADYAGTTKDMGNGFAPGGVGMPAAAVVNVTALDTTDDLIYTSGPMPGVTWHKRHGRPATGNRGA